MAFLSFSVLLSKNAYQKINSAFADAQGEYEVGGVLLGYKLWRIHYVIAVTVSNKSPQKSATSFFLDGKKHTALAAEEANKCCYPPVLLGVWHSHPNGMNTFSEQDRLSNKRLAQTFNGALSILVTADAAELCLKSYYISVDGAEIYCHTSIINKRGSKMNNMERCSNCVYWQHRKCMITNEIKNDSVCICGQFKERDK